ncbi:S41 family peptidase [Embleya sp. AB8]|uniref:S41 family peptidase n=1 Tax=Embleya sp. AB8 TaxID=3156304 RepID=UPI003C763462
MDGYATVLRIEGDTLDTYHRTRANCVRQPYPAARLNGPDAAGVTRYGSALGTFVLTPGPTRERAVLRVEGSVGVRGLRRRRQLPRAARVPTPGDALTTFDIFWDTFAENYPFFAAKGIDWRDERSYYRPQVHVKTTDDALFALLEEMIRPLHDAHTKLRWGEHEYTGSRPGTRDPDEKFEAGTRRFVDTRDLKRPPTSLANDRISYADLPGGLGYLRVSGFSGYTPTRTDFAQESAALDQALRSVFTAANTGVGGAWRGLIVDIRVNHGGKDALGLQLASWLTCTSYLAYTKQARNDPNEPTRYTDPQPIDVVPADGPVYTGPVALLTSGASRSAAETFAQALVARPRTTRIGENTQGIFSDVMGCQLPDGLIFGLPNEIYLTAANTTFDGAGIPPDIRMPVFTREEFHRGRDSAFDEAVRLLGR